MHAPDPERQPAGRPPAPGRLGAVQAYVNAFWDLDADGVDRWRDVAGYRAWLAARGWADDGVGEAQRAEAIAVREALRALARANHDALAPDPRDLATLDAAARRAPVLLRFGAAPHHEPLAGGHQGALALTLAVVAEAMTDGSWERMKVCPGPHCGWLYFDASRNRSSQWCSMRICGNRAKGRAFRARRAGADGAAPKAR